MHLWSKAMPSAGHQHTNSGDWRNDKTFAFRSEALLRKANEAERKGPQAMCSRVPWHMGSKMESKVEIPIERLNLHQTCIHWRGRLSPVCTGAEIDGRPSR